MRSHIARAQAITPRDLRGTAAKPCCKPRRLMQTEFRPESMQLAQRVLAHARARDRTPTGLALGWVWNNRLVHGLIGGPRTLTQWQDYLDALRQPFDAEDEAFFAGLVPAGHASTPGYTDAQYPVTGRVPRSG